MNARPQDDALILCVEDEETLRRDIAEELGEAGYRVVEAASCEEALSQLEAVRPDLILCDICMPGMDGYDFLRLVQAGPDDRADIPFVFLSALADRKQVVEGKLLGADDYLTKPIDFDLMLATIHARLRQITRIRTARPGAGIEARLATLTGGASQPADPGLNAVLDLISTAIVLVGPGPGVRLANRAARELAGACAPLADALESWADARRKTGFTAWIEGMLAPGNDAGVSSFNLPCDSGPDTLQMVGCRLDGVCNQPGRDGDDGGAPRLALFIAQSGREPKISVEPLRSMFGFTPSEGLIAAGLAQGQNPAEIAGALGVSPTTVAFHMRNIFQKTGVSRQASLVALLLTSPASIL